MKDTLKTIEKYFLIIICLIFIVGIIMIKDDIKDILTFLLKILKPMIGGGFISYLLYPFIKKLDGKLKIKKDSIRRGVSITITYIIAGSILSGLIFLCAPPIAKSLKEIVEKAPDIYLTIENYMNNEKFNELTNKISDTGAFVDMFKNIISNAAPMVITWIGSIVKFGTNFFIYLIISIYISFDFLNISNNMKRFLRAYLDDKITNKLIDITNECDKVFHRFIVGKAIDSTIIGIITFIVLIILKIRYPVLLAVVVGITNMIPYVGPFIGGIIGGIILLIISPEDTLLFAILIIVIQQFDGHILGPKILSQKISIGPLWIIMAVSIGGFICGITGMFLGPPVLATITHLLDENVNNRLNKKENEPE